MENEECVKEKTRPRSENSPTTPMGLQHSDKILHLNEGFVFNWPINKKYTSSAKWTPHSPQKQTNEKKNKKTTQD